MILGWRSAHVNGRSGIARDRYPFASCEQNMAKSYPKSSEETTSETIDFEGNQSLGEPQDSACAENIPPLQRFLLESEVTRQRFSYRSRLAT